MKYAGSQSIIGNKFIGLLLACAVLLTCAACFQTTAPDNSADEAAQLVQKGDMLSQQGSYKEAIEEYTGAIELDAALADAYIARGQAYYFVNRNLMAVSDYSRAIELAPESTAAYYGRGWAHLANRAYDSAISDFTEVIERLSQIDRDEFE